MGKVFGYSADDHKKIIPGDMKMPGSKLTLHQQKQKARQANKAKEAKAAAVAPVPEAAAADAFEEAKAVAQAAGLAIPVDAAVKDSRQNLEPKRSVRFSEEPPQTKVFEIDDGNRLIAGLSNKESNTR